MQNNSIVRWSFLLLYGYDIIHKVEKYIDYVHTVDGVPLKVPTGLQNKG